jgi:hypothetical protein
MTGSPVNMRARAYADAPRMTENMLSFAWKITSHKWPLRFSFHTGDSHEGEGEHLTHPVLFTPKQTVWLQRWYSSRKREEFAQSQVRLAHFQAPHEIQRKEKEMKTSTNDRFFFPRTCFIRGVRNLWNEDPTSLAQRPRLFTCQSSLWWAGWVQSLGVLAKSLPSLGGCHLLKRSCYVCRFQLYQENIT